MTEIESFSVIPFSACPLQNLKGIIMSPEQLIKADLKLILQHPFIEQMSFAPKTPQQFLFWMWQMEITNTTEKISWAKVPIQRFCLY